jgi:predicted short-subunit dehydrogenase-like oxidoreductase (DUF2520 family)
MRELERDLPLTNPDAALGCSIVGAGRLGNALATALRAAGHEVEGPLRRGQSPNAGIVLLCVPDGEIAAAAAAIEPGPLVGHCSGASGLDVLAPHAGFSLHPLMTVTEAGASFAGAGAAIDGATPAARDCARSLAISLGMRPIELAAEDRAAYHAAASVASNFLVTLEAAAERIAASAGVERADLAPLVRATVENWIAAGPERALTGPVARGDCETVARQRAAVAERTPELLGLFDAFTTATTALADSTRSLTA